MKRNAVVITIIVVLIITLIIMFSGAAGYAHIYEAAREGDLETVQKGLEKDPNVLNEKDEQGSTLLHYAANHGHKHIVEFLLSRGADTSIRNKKGKLAYHLANINGHKEIVNLLENPENTGAEESKPEKANGSDKKEENSKNEETSNEE
ncbi:MAG: ankyrin repeat domain-containing protein [Vulcanimicrobiota bacterium]